MRTINHEADHRHVWATVGAHALHAGTKPRGEPPYPDKRVPLREVRTVFLCRHPGCNAVRVSISRHLVLGLASAEGRLRQPRPVRRDAARRLARAERRRRVAEDRRAVARFMGRPASS